MKTTMKQFKHIALLGLLAIIALGASAQVVKNAAVTVTMRNGKVYSYSKNQLDSMRYVGGDWSTAGTTGVGVKIYCNGSTQSFDYLYSQMSDLEVVEGDIATPVISPNGGTIRTATTVTITCSTSGATIYYTVDGTTPTSSSTVYSGSFTVSATTTVKAIAIKSGNESNVATATFTFTTETDNNLNANWKSSNWNKNNGSMSYTPNKCGFYRLEVPRISEESNTSWLQKSTSSYGVTYAVEWSNTRVSNRWSCYQLHSGNNNGSQTVSKTFNTDSELPSSTRSTDNDYSGSGYSRGHLCPSADRKMSTEQNKQTYYFGNMQPQWQGHNGGQWEELEGDVRSWSLMSTCDTLYVVKAATIDNITLNGTTESGYYSTTYNGTTYSDLKCNGKLIVPKYFYMALLAYNKSANKYYAMGIWTKHYNGGTNGADSKTHNWPIINKESAEYITIDELEKRTGIDFFCNLPDDIEDEVEATLDTSYWTSGGIKLNR